MKRFLAFSIFILLIAAYFSNVAYSQQINVNIGNTSAKYNGKVYSLELNGIWIPTETPCIIVSGVAYVPLREVFQNYLGLTVGYDNNTQMAYVQSDSRKMEFDFHNQSIYQNGKKLESDLPVASIDGNTMVPLSATAGYFGYTVAVKPDNNTITIQWKNKDETGAIVKDTTVKGTVNKISYYPDNNREIIFIETLASEITNHYVLKPMDGNSFYRLCVQFKSARIDNPGSMDVYAGSVQQIRFAQHDVESQIANVVVEIDHEPRYTVDVVSKGIQIAVLSDKTDSAQNPPVNTTAPEPTKAPEPTLAPKPGITPTPSQPIPLPEQPVAAPTPAPIIGNGAIRYTTNGNNVIVWLDGINLPEEIMKNPNLYNVEYRNIEKMLQIRMPLNDRYKTEVLPGNSLIHGIISFSSKMRNEVVIRISGREDLFYNVEPNGSDGTIIVLAADQDFAAVTAPEKPKEEASAAKPEPYPEESPPGNSPSESVPTPDIPKQPPENEPQVTPGPTEPSQNSAPDEPISRGEGDRAATVEYVAGSDKIIIDTINLDNYRIFRLSNPSRMVIDLYKNTINQAESAIAPGRMYTKIRTGQFETTTARIVLELTEDHDWEEVKNGNRLIVTIKPSGLKNLAFINDGDTACLKLTGPGIRQKIEQNMDSIVIEDDKKTKTFSFIFDNLADLGNGKLQVGDSLMKTVHTLTSSNKSFLVISRENADVPYRIRYTGSNDEVIIEPLNTIPGNSGTSDGTDSHSGAGAEKDAENGAKTQTPATQPVSSGKLVVLDAGHGGHDPGATYGKDEKWYNLDIAKRTEAILLSKGVNVKMTRTSDIFVGLDERARMANDWGADLFISIHNNAFFDKKMLGTMTFYYTGSYKGKEYATIIQQDLLRNLGSKDLGVKANTFVVLKKTKMPACLVEIGCLSNEEERAKLDTEAYRQKAAESLAESILKIIG